MASGGASQSRSGNGKLNTSLRQRLGLRGSKANGGVATAHRRLKRAFRLKTYAPKVSEWSDD
jgi:hypothetical protein